MDAFWSGEEELCRIHHDEDPDLVESVLGSNADDNIKQRAQILKLSLMSWEDEAAQRSIREVASRTGTDEATVREVRTLYNTAGIRHALSAERPETPDRWRIDGLIAQFCRGIEQKVSEMDGIFLNLVHVMHGRHWIIVKEHDHLGWPYRPHSDTEIQVHISAVEVPEPVPYMLGDRYQFIHDIDPVSRVAAAELARLGIDHVHLWTIFLVDVEAMHIPSPFYLDKNGIHRYVAPIGKGEIAIVPLLPEGAADAHWKQTPEAKHARPSDLIEGSEGGASYTAHLSLELLL